MRDDSKLVRQWLLENIQEWNGLMGTYSLDENGNSDLGFIVKKIQDGEFVEI